MLTKPPTQEAGLTILEVLLGMIVAILLVGLGLRTTARMHSQQRANEYRARLQEHSERALRAIVQDLRRSVNRTTPGSELPYVFDDGVAASPYTSHSHTPAASEAKLGDPDYGPNREIVYILPQDTNGDGRPDLAGNAVIWAPEEISFTVITDQDGNALVRTVNHGTPTVVARYVERIVFDTAASSGFTIPLGTVRAQLFLRTRDESGNLYRHESEALVRLQQEN